MQREPRVEVVHTQASVAQILKTKAKQLQYLARITYEKALRAGHNADGEHTAILLPE